MRRLLADACMACQGAGLYPPEEMRGAYDGVLEHTCLSALRIFHLGPLLRPDLVPRVGKLVCGACSGKALPQISFVPHAHPRYNPPDMSTPSQYGFSLRIHLLLGPA